MLGTVADLGVLVPWANYSCCAPTYLGCSAPTLLWEILSEINTVNVSLSNACTLMEGLQVCLNKIRENFDETIVNSSKPIAHALEITDSLQEKRVKKAKRQSDEKAEDESRSLSVLQTFRQHCFLVLDRVIAEMKKRFFCHAQNLHSFQDDCT